MELKDVVLSTLAEMEDNEIEKQDFHNPINKVTPKEIKPNPEFTNIQIDDKEEKEIIEPADDELYFLTSVRERLLVLFEGFQAPNNKEIEAKIDMTLNFLEYTLATIDKRLEKLKKGDKWVSIEYL